MFLAFTLTRKRGSTSIWENFCRPASCRTSPRCDGQYGRGCFVNLVTYLYGWLRTDDDWTRQAGKDRSGGRGRGSRPHSAESPWHAHTVLARAARLDTAKPG